MSNKGRRSREKSDEVEELLRAAEDEVLLQLTRDSHLSHTSSSSPLDQDLARRFEALRSNAPVSSKVVMTPSSPPEKPDQEKKDDKAREEDDLEGILGVDLSARFAALKGSSSSSSSSSSYLLESQMVPRRSNDGGHDRDIKDGNEEDDEISEAEVEKLMQWAMDAARLDPSQNDDDDEEVNLASKNNTKGQNQT